MVNTKKKVLKKTGKKNVSPIFTDFISSINYLRQIRIHILIAVLLFLISAIIGYSDLIGKIAPELSLKIQELVSEQVLELVKQTEGFGAFEMIGFIMTNNIKTAFFGLISGIYFGIIPIIIILFNGFILGFVSNLAVYSPENNIGLLILWRLFPHGIFEIPAILISIGLGINIGLFPLHIKERTKGFLALLLSFIIFIFSFSFLSMIINFLFNPKISSVETIILRETSSNDILQNPVGSVILMIFGALLFILSLYIGFSILSNKDRKIAYETMFKSLKVFLYIVVPLLVIAGIIEGLLIIVMG
jgi:uncharacterized membrane protein SpoIIM required for sporulation